MSRPLLPTELWAQTDEFERCGKPHEHGDTLPFLADRKQPAVLVFALMIRPIEVARGMVVVAACFAALASASSSQNTWGGQGSQTMAPPPPQPMPPTAALGLWMTSFGAVKIEQDLSRSAEGTEFIHGVWTYQDRRDGREVIGYFTGALRGNVFEFRWQEPTPSTAMVGSGFLVFDVMGRQFNGRWRTDAGDRGGDWSGWRQPAGQTTPPVQAPYGQAPTYQQPGPGRQTDPYAQPPSPPQRRPGVGEKAPPTDDEPMDPEEPEPRYY
jgi:hypothetical protein